MVFGGAKIGASTEDFKGRSDIYILDVQRSRVQKVSQDDSKLQYVKGFLTVYPVFMSQDKKIHYISEEAAKDETPTVQSFSIPDLLKNTK